MDEGAAKNQFGQPPEILKATRKTFAVLSINVRMDGEKGMAMRFHRFTLILAGVANLEPEIANALYEATGGDIEFNMRDGVAFLEFNRKAPSLQKAITSAIRDVEGASVGVRVIRVESEAANTIAKINADLLGVSKSKTNRLTEQSLREHP
jgi:hypothetical protein